MSCGVYLLPYPFYDSGDEEYMLKDDKCRGCEMSLNTCPSCGIVYCDKCKEYVKTGETTSDMAEHLL